MIPLLWIAAIVFQFMLPLFVEDRGYWDFCGAVKVIEADFQKYFMQRHDYPAHTLSELKHDGAFNESSWEYLNAYRVHYIPFSSKTPDGNVVLKIGYGFSVIPWNYDFSLTKADLTHDWDAIIFQQGEKFVKIDSTHREAFLHAHPSCVIIATPSRWEGRGEGATAHCVVVFECPKDTQRHEEQLNYIWQFGDWKLVSVHTN